MNFTAIDFETANSYRGSACSIGLVKVENGIIADRFSYLIKPEPFVFDPFNVSIHGISGEDVQDAPSFSELWPTLLSRISGPLVAHNASFDMSVLRRVMDDSSLQYPDTDYFCTRVISALAWPDYPTYALSHIANTLGISFAHHDAEEDAFACAAIAIEACNKLGASSLYDLKNICGFRIGHLYPGGYCPCGRTRTSLYNAPNRPGIEICISNSGVTILKRQSTCTAEEQYSPPAKTEPIKPALSIGIVSGKQCADESGHTPTAIFERHPFYGMSFVFTGAMTTMTRIHAMQAVIDRGGVYHDTLKSDTNFLVLGQEGFIGYKNGHKSAKMKRAELMKSKGLPINILSEDNFIRML